MGAGAKQQQNKEHSHIFGIFPKNSKKNPKICEKFGIFRKISGISGVFGTFPKFWDFPENFRNLGISPENSGILGFSLNFRSSGFVRKFLAFWKLFPKKIRNFGGKHVQNLVKKTRFYTTSPPPPPGMPTLFL